jgi:hypothetical protein
VDLGQMKAVEGFEGNQKIISKPVAKQVLKK